MQTFISIARTYLSYTYLCVYKIFFIDKIRVYIFLFIGAFAVCSRWGLEKNFCDRDGERKC